MWTTFRLRWTPAFLCVPLLLSLTSAGVAYAARKPPTGGGTSATPAFATDPYKQYKDRVATLAADGSGLTTLSGPLIMSPRPQWSPDGRQIFYFDRLSLTFLRIDSRTGAQQAVRAYGKSGLPDFDWSNVDVGACGSLIVFSGGSGGTSDGEEGNLYVMNSSLSREYKIATAHDGDDVLIGHVGDPTMGEPAWSANGRYIVTTEQAAYPEPYVPGSQVTRILDVECTSATTLAMQVSAEIPLGMDFGSLVVNSWGGYDWSRDGRYIAFTVYYEGFGAGGDLWVADLGDPAAAGYPDATPELLRLTGTDRPIGTGSVVEQGAAFAPDSHRLAFVTNLTGSDRTDSLYTMDAGACIAAVRSGTGISSACAVTNVSPGINSRNVDWRPNWPNAIP